MYSIKTMVNKETKSEITLDIILLMDFRKQKTTQVPLSSLAVGINIFVSNYNLKLFRKIN